MLWKRIRSPLFFALLGVAIGFGAGRFSLRGSTATGRRLPHYLNTMKARAIKPGVSLSCVIEELGDPIGQADGRLLFEPSPNGRTIRVKLDRSGLVESIDAGAD